MASGTRSLTITGDNSYTFNEGTVGAGTATIQNTGVSSTFIDSVSFATSEFTIAAGASQEISFSIMSSASGDQEFTISVIQTIPANAAAGASASVTFNVVNGDGSSAVVTTTANQEYGVTVSVGTLTGLKPGESGDLSFTVINTGNGLDTFTIGHSGVWASAKSDNSVTLASGSSATVTVTVDIPSNSASSESSAITLSASSVALSLIHI